MSKKLSPAQKRNYAVQSIGVIAFVIGGLLARANAIEGVDTLAKTFQKKRFQDDVSGNDEQ